MSVFIARLSERLRPIFDNFQKFHSDLCICWNYCRGSKSILLTMLNGNANVSYIRSVKQRDLTSNVHQSRHQSFSKSKPAERAKCVFRSSEAKGSLGRSENSSSSRELCSRRMCNKRTKSRRQMTEWGVRSAYADGWLPVSLSLHSSTSTEPMTNFVIHLEFSFVQWNSSNFAHHLVKPT